MTFRCRDLVVAGSLLQNRRCAYADGEVSRVRHRAGVVVFTGALRHSRSSLRKAIRKARRSNHGKKILEGRRLIGISYCYPLPEHVRKTRRRPAVDMLD